MSLFLQCRSLRAPITAIAQDLRLLFVGEGPYLRVHDLGSFEELSAKLIFNSHAIHGIAVKEDQHGYTSLVVWGGRYLRLVEINHSHLGEAACLISISLGDVAIAPDWILDLALESSSSDEITLMKAAALTAHNALLSIEIRKDEVAHENTNSTHGNPNPKFSLRQVTAGSRCILYAAHLMWTAPKRLLIASGTAFGEIVVWSVDLSDSRNVNSQLHYVFTGHEGSIFGVRISMALVSADDGPSRVLASCSDDRTIRIWDLSELTSSKVSENPSRTLDSLRDRDTGFGANIETLEDVYGVRQRSLAIAFGHLSRIWGVQFVEPCYEDDHSTFQLVSSGEDATCQLWEFVTIPQDGSDGHQLRHKSSAGHHSGKNIWATSLTQKARGVVSTFTGGADGAIIASSFSTNQDARAEAVYVDKEWTVTQLYDAINLSSNTSTDLSEEAESRAMAKFSPRDVVFRAYSFVSENEVVATTSDGNIFAANLSSQFETDSTPLWRHINHTEDLRGSSICTSEKRSNLVFMAGSKGHVYYYCGRSNTCALLSKVDGKVAGLFTHTETPSAGGKSRTVSILVTNIGGMAAHFLAIDFEVDNGEYAVQQSYTIPLVGGLVVTSFVHFTDSDLNGHIIVGNRSGSLSVYVRRHNVSDEDQVINITTAHSVHEQESVTALHWKPFAGVNNGQGFLFSVGRDGTCAVHSYDLNMKNFLIVHKAALPFGPNIEGFHANSQTGALMVYGFHGKHFKLLDLLNEHDVVSIECGGAHRQWAFSADDKESGGGTLVWTKASRLRIFRNPHVSHRVVQHGGHGREIKAIAVSKSHLNGISSPLIATGAEDTNIKLYLANGTATAAQLTSYPRIRTIRKHVTGIQSLQWSSNGRFLFSSGGCEEFYVWRVRSIPLLDVGMVCEAVCPTGTEASDLRIMSFDFLEEHNELDADVHAFVICMVFSDSTVRIYRYTSTPQLKAFELLQTGCYLTVCLTQAVFLSPRKLLTASTNGHLALWNIDLSPAALNGSNTVEENTLAYNTHHRIHQSSIKALTHRQLSAEKMLILTTGDDNGIGFTISTTSTTDGSVTVSSILVPRAHAAAITACELLEAPSASDVKHYRAVTASNDQRLKIWEIIVDPGKQGVDGVNVLLKEDMPSAVADASCLAVYQKDDDGGVNRAHIVICGVGMEEWTMDLGAARCNE